MGAVSPSALGAQASSGLLEEVREFLLDLRRELPRVFPEASRGRPRRIPFRGGELELRVVRGACARSSIRETEAGLEILRSEEDGLRPQDLLREWYREKARQAFSERAAHWAGLMGVGFSGIRIKDQRSLWGSCSRAGKLNFNWRLVMAPPEVLDYLVIHELAHLLEMNHSRRFWACVCVWCPGHKAFRKWLREHGQELRSGVRGRTAPGRPLP